MTDRLPRGRWSVAAAFAVAAAGCLLYINALHNPFVFDDYASILENRSLDNIRDLRGILLFTPTRPLINISYAIDGAIWGLRDPFGFHITNVLLHAISVLLFFAVARRAVWDYLQRTDARPPVVINADVAAVSAAALLAVHPVMTEAVGYISSRTELICCAFVMGALLAARRWMREGGATWWLVAVVSWVAAVTAKEVAAVLPIVLLAYDRLIAPGDAPARRRRTRWLHVPLLTLMLVAGVVRLAVLMRIEFPNELFWHWPFAWIQLDAMRRYLELLIVPHDQAVFHPASDVTSLFDIRVMAVPVLLLAATAVSWRLKAGRIALFGLLTFVLFLTPSSVLYVLGIGEVMAEHRVYVASTGVFLACGAGVGWLAAQLHLVPKKAQWVAWVAVSFLFIQLAALTVARNRVWQNPVVLWREAVAGAPNDWLPRIELAETLRQADRCAEAVPHYQLASAIKPEDSYTYSRLGACQLRLQRFDDAARTFANLGAVAPTSAEGPLGLALVMIARRTDDDPRPMLRSALQRDPSSIAARQLLASLEESDHPSEALRLCREIQQLAPGTAGADDCVQRNAARVAR